MLFEWGEPTEEVELFSDDKNGLFKLARSNSTVGDDAHIVPQEVVSE